MSKAYRYEIEPRPAAVGSGWCLRLYEDGQEVGGGIFPPTYSDDWDDEEASRLAHAEAQDLGEHWLATRAEA